MKQVFYMVLFLTCIGSFAQEIVAIEAMPENNISHSASGNHHIYIYPSDFFMYAANMEDVQHTLQRLAPRFQRCSVSGDSFASETCLKRSSSINYYTACAENQIVRFEGAAIIHPFNYFW